MAGRGPHNPQRDRQATPRRVKHLILLPGGREDGADPVEDSVQEDDQQPERGRDVRRRPSLLRGRLRRRPRLEPPDPPDRPEAPNEETDDPSSAGMGRPPIPLGGLLGASVGGGAQAALDTLPLELPAPSSFKLKLSVISRSVASSRRPGMPFIIFASILVSMMVLGLVILRVMVDQASFRMNSLAATVTKQQVQLRQLHYVVSTKEAPARIASEALNLGLIPAREMQTVVGAGAAVPTATVTAPASTPGSGPSNPAKATKPAKDVAPATGTRPTVTPASPAPPAPPAAATGVRR